MENRKNIIKLCDIKKNYDFKSPQSEHIQKAEVLKGIDMEIREGEYISIMGRSGSGKTTLLKIIGLMLPPTDGCMLFEDKDVSELWEDELADIRRKRIGFVYQDFHLLDSLSAIQNIILPAMIDKMNENEAKKRAYALAEQLELSKNLLTKAPYELSGGEKQRVAICRALMNNPDLVLADEPTGNLDEESGRLVSAILKDINTTMKKAIIMVTHNPQLASTTEKVCLLKRGKIAEVLVQDSTPEDYYKMILQKM